MAKVVGSVIVLHKAAETNFDCLGIGVITDALSCTVTEEANGSYELYMVYPAAGKYARQLQVDMILTAPANQHTQVQPFRIYSVSPALAAMQITVRAEHISYQLRHIPIREFSVKSAAGALDAIAENAVTDLPFSFSTDIADSQQYVYARPQSARRMLMGDESSIATIAGGELEFDRYQVTLHKARGRNTGVVISRGRNLRELEQTIDIQSLVTGYYPYWFGRDEDGNEISNQGMLVTLDAPWSYPRILPLDLSGDFSKMPTFDDMHDYASWKLKRGVISAVMSSIVDFLPLWQTAQHGSRVPPEKIGLCDTLHIKVDLFNIDAKAKIVRTVYNVLTGRYDKLEVGDLCRSLPRTLSKILTRIM